MISITPTGSFNGYIKTNPITREVSGVSLVNACYQFCGEECYLFVDATAWYMRSVAPNPAPSQLIDTPDFTASSASYTQTFPTERLVTASIINYRCPAGYEQNADQQTNPLDFVVTTSTSPLFAFIPTANAASAICSTDGATTTCTTDDSIVSHGEVLFIIMVFIVLLTPPFFRFLFGKWGK